MLYANFHAFCPPILSDALISTHKSQKRSALVFVILPGRCLLLSISNSSVILPGRCLLLSISNSSVLSSDAGLSVVSVLDSFTSGLGCSTKLLNAQMEITVILSVNAYANSHTFSKTCHLRSLFWTATCLIRPLYWVYLSCQSLDFIFILSIFRKAFRLLRLFSVIKTSSLTKQVLCILYAKNNSHWATTITDLTSQTVGFC